MKSSAIAVAMIVGIVLTMLFIPLFVYTSHLVVESLDPTFDRLFSSELAACQKGECGGIGFHAARWSLEGVVTLCPLLISVTPLAVGAALMRKYTWVTGVVMGCGAVTFMLFGNLWLIFAPARMPGWLFIPLFGALVVLAFGLVGGVVAKYAMAPNTSLERTRDR